MAYIHSDKLLELRSIDLLSYLKRSDPTNLVRISRDVYCTREHDSLKISNGKWYWWSRGIGGVSALDYLIKVKGYSFLEAANMLLNENTGEVKANADKKEVESREKELLLPKKNGNSDIVRAYLLERGIDEDIINSCINDGSLYESLPHHSAVFIGKDEKGNARYANIRGTYGDFKGEAYGSDKRYSFRLMAEYPCSSLHIFESAIDLLSYATYISDTSAKDKIRQEKPYGMRQLLSALIDASPAAFQPTDDLNVPAFYDGENQTIFVKTGLLEEELFKAVTKEISAAIYHVKFNESRESSSFKSYCVAFMIASKYGIDTSDFNFDKSTDVFKNLDSQTLKSELGSMRDVLGEIQTEMYRNFEKNKTVKNREQER